MSRFQCIAAALALALAAGCGGGEGAPAPAAKGAAAPKEGKSPAPKRRNPVDVFLASIDAFNSSKPAKMRDALSSDAAWWSPCTGRPPMRGIRAIMGSLTGFKGLIPDAAVGVRRVLRRDGMLVAQAVTAGTKKWSAHGTQEEPKRVGYEVVYFVLAADDGRMKETLLYFDPAVAMRQTGSLTGEARVLPGLPKEAPEIVDAAEIDGAVELATAALTAFGKKGEEIAPVVAPDFTYVDTKSGKTLDVASLPAFLAAERRTEAGLAYAVQQSLAAGPYVALRWEATGRFPGEGTVGPTDVVLHGVHVFRIAGGRVASAEAYASDFEYLQKTGLIAQAIKTDEEDVLGPRGPVPGVRPGESEDEIGKTAPAPPAAPPAGKP